MILETVVVGPMEANCYILAEGPNEKAIIIDPGDDERTIRRVLDKHGLVAGMVINTHGHVDHIGCDDSFGAPVYVHSADLALLKDPYLNLSAYFAERKISVKSQISTLEDKDRINLGSLVLEVIHLPGHTPGGIALFVKEPESKVIFTGDALFYHGIGRSDCPGGDAFLLIRSIKEKLLNLPPDTAVYPGHGPSTTIGQEKKENEFLN